jgi:YegS/Rv2252/BmrU family lipid kinase
MAVSIIVNPVAGRRPDVPSAVALARSIKDVDGRSPDVYVTDSPGHARDLTRRSVGRGARLVIAWGGDGTINEVACELAFSQIAMGIVPAGSGNGLARELGVAFDPRQAIEEAIRADARPMDLGELGGRLFANIAGIGLDAQIAAWFADRPNARRGLPGYLALTGRALLTCRPATYVVTANGGSVIVRALLVTFANSAQFGNGARISPGARVDDGALDLVVVEERWRGRTLCHLPRLFTGSVGRMPGYSSRPIQDATIESETPMPFHVDGEAVQGGTSLRARVHAGALRVAVR